MKQDAYPAGGSAVVKLEVFGIEGLRSVQGPAPLVGETDRAPSLRRLVRDPEGDKPEA
jgi:hypothetical protein